MKKITKTFNGKKALVVDDYELNQELTKEMMEMMGCDVDVASDGAEALEKYRSTEYDVIMMDVQMPEMDGYQVTQKIREYEQSNSKPHAPIIAITANAMPGDQEKCLNAGMDDYISKPLKGETLQNKLTKYLT